MVMKKKVLIVGTYVNAPYHPFQQVDHALAELLAPDFDVTVTDDLSVFQRMQGYDLCISYIDMFDAALPEGTGEAILSFVRGGGGLLCLHNGISLQTDERLLHLIGGKFTEHPPQTELRFTPAEDGFLQGMEGFSMSEEPYQFEMSGDEVVPLLRYQYEGREYLGGWCRTEEKGRVVFLTPGHNIAAFRFAAYLIMIKKSAEWAIGEQRPDPRAEKKTRHYTPEFKAAALAMMEEKGAVATVKELGISSYTLYDWKSKAEGQKYPRRQGPLSGKARKRYTPEFKTEVIAYYQSHGARETLQKYGIVNNSLYNWLDEAGVDRVGSDHTRAIALYREKGEDAVLEEYGIARSTLRDWLREAGIKLHSPKYSLEFKAAAVAMTEEKPLTAVAKELGLPASTLATWKTNTRKER